MPHLTSAELRQHLNEAAHQVVPGQVYEHYRGGRYTVKELVIIEATEAVGVVYRANYDDQITFMRPLDSWLETVQVEDSSVPRFRLANN